MNSKIALEKLGLFAGTWQTKGIQFSENGEIPFYGTDRYEWLPGGFFILHTVDVMLGDERVQSIEVIGFDEKKNTYFLHSYDQLGQFGVMHGHFEGNQWKIESPELRFRGEFQENNQVLAGVWENLADGKWQLSMDMRLTKTGI